jgi:hypothetical protein
MSNQSPISRREFPGAGIRKDLDRDYVLPFILRTATADAKWAETAFDRSNLQVLRRFTFRARSISGCCAAGHR